MRAGRAALRHPASLLLVASVIATLACASSQRTAYATIDDATKAVQQAVKAYKAHCGVPSGALGSGTCDPAEYAKSKIAYVTFQKTALDAVAIAETSGQTPLEVVTQAAASALEIIASLKGGK